MNRLTEKEKAWIREYFKADGNATAATRTVYGGTPGACRVKGHKKAKKFETILREIREREFDKMECQGMSGIDFYLGNHEREVEEGERFMEAVGGTRGLIQLARALR